MPTMQRNRPATTEHTMTFAAKTCAVCGAVFTPASGAAKACSAECSRQARADRARAYRQTEEYRERTRERNRKRAPEIRDWRINNAERIREQDIQRSASKRRERQMQYLANPRPCEACGKAIPWEQARHSTLVVRCAPCQEAHARNASNEWTKRAYHTNPSVKARMISHAHTRRARILGVDNEHINARTVFERDAWKCQRLGCGKTTSLDLPRTHHARAVLGHINALAAGGSHTYGNVVCLCHRCNSEDGVNRAAIQMGLIA
jgi:hypothetical protein